MVNFKVILVICNFFIVSGIVTCECILYSNKINKFFFPFYYFVSVLVLSTYCRTVFTCPGFVDKNERQLVDIEHLGTGKKFCFKCFCEKDQNIHHCNTCGRCVRNMSHHCKWVDNCIGKDNQKFFILFLGYSCLWAGFNIGVCGSLLNEICEDFEGYKENVGVGLLAYAVVEGLVSFFFCFRVLYVQIISIRFDRTLVYVVSYDHKEAKPFCFNFKRIFGNNYFCWLFPISVQISIDIQDNEKDEQPRANVNTTLTIN